MWKYTIEALYSEMYPKIKTNTSNINKINKLFKYYKKVGALVDHKIVDDEVISTLNTNNFETYYRINDAIEKNLRLIADKRNMLIPDDKDMFGR